MTSPTAVILSLNARLDAAGPARNRLPLVCTRPPKLKLGPGKKLKSVSEKTPNWKTGIATVSRLRLRWTSPPEAVRAVDSSVYCVRSAISPWYGPDEIGRAVPRGLPLASGHAPPTPRPALPGRHG